MAAPAQADEPKLLGVGGSGNSWYTRLTLTTSIDGAVQSTSSVRGLPSQQAAAHARDLLLLAKERLYGLSSLRYDKLHFPRSVYAGLTADLQRCSDMQQAAALINRLGERGELTELAQASAAAGLTPQARRPPPSALMGELEGRDEEQQQNHQQQPQNQQQRRRASSAAAAAAAAGAGAAGAAAPRAAASHSAERGSTGPASLQIKQTRQEVQMYRLVKEGGHIHITCIGRMNVPGKHKRQVVDDLMRLWRQMQRRQPLEAAALHNRMQCYEQAVPQLEQCNDPEQLMRLLNCWRKRGQLDELAAATRPATAAGPAVAAVAAVSSGSSGSAGQRGSGRSIEAAAPLWQRQQQPRQPRRQRQQQEQGRRRQHLRWEEDGEDEDGVELRQRQPPKQRQPRRQQDGNQDPLSQQAKKSKRPRQQQEQPEEPPPQPRVLPAEPERPGKKKRKKERQQEQHEQGGSEGEEQLEAPPARLQLAAEPERPAKKKRKKERRQQGGSEGEEQPEAPQQQQPQAPPARLQLAAELERPAKKKQKKERRQQQEQEASEGEKQPAAGVAAGAEPQQQAWQAAAPQQPSAGLPDLPPTMPPGSSPWWALNRLRPFLEERCGCSAAQVSSLGLRFVDAEGEEQQGLYSMLAGSLRAGDAAGAARWVRKYAG